MRQAVGNCCSTADGKEDDNNLIISQLPYKNHTTKFTKADQANLLKHRDKIVRAQALVRGFLSRQRVRKIYGFQVRRRENTSDMMTLDAETL